MSGDGLVHESLGALGQFLVGETTLAEALQHIVDLAHTAVVPATYVGISMLVDDEVTTAVFSDAEVCEIDQSQYESGHGPCLNAFRDGCVYKIPSTAADERWPAFSRVAHEHGVRSTLSLPLIAGEQRLGALNIYAGAEEAFSDADQHLAQAFATQASVVLANSQAYWDARALSEQLSEAMQSRATIEQAKGILMARSKVGADEAFDMLRRASQRENRKLREIASEIVDRVGNDEAAT